MVGSELRMTSHSDDVSIASLTILSSNFLQK